MSWRCTVRTCQTYKSVRTNLFLTFMDKDNRPCSNLPLSRIITIVYFWLHGTDTVEQMMFKTGKWEGTITQKLQVDEPLFQGKRKYHRVRLRIADKKPQNEMKKRINIQKLTPEYTTSKKNRNQGERVQSP